ncbi:MAG: NosD domain-containing protein [Candidatus Saccharimonadales bacterium]
MFLGVSPHIRRFATILIIFLTSAAIGGILLFNDTSAAPGINQTINFQGRLYTASGATVPDGYYNLEFKIYQDGTGTAVGNPGGTLKWTESHLNATSNGVTVRNGFMSVELGSVTAFGSSVDWNQDTLWLSMNIGNTNVSCTPFASCVPDGEMVPMKRLSAVPYAMNAMQLGGKTAGDFIQSGTSPQVANFNITGTGIAGILQSSTLDTAAAGTLTIGGTNATSITLADNTVLGAGLSLTLTGGNTASRPASPTEGMLYYDSTTKQLLVYANGKWQADRSTSTVIVGTSATGGVSTAVASKSYDSADYVNTSTTSAQTVINSAISALPAGGGTVYLMEGTYIIDGSISLPSNVTLAGAGSATILKLKNAFNNTSGLIVNSDTTNGNDHITVKNLQLNGNKANQASGSANGILFTKVGGGAVTSGAHISDIWVESFTDSGIVLTTSSRSAISNVSSQYNSNNGITLGGTTFSSVVNSILSDNNGSGSAGLIISATGYGNVVTGNVMNNNTTSGFIISGSSYNNTVSGNSMASNNTNGISLTNTTDNNVSGNIIKFSGTNGVRVNASSNNSITNNTISDSGQVTAGSDGIILLSTSSNNNVSGNKVTDSAGTGYAYNISDGGSTSNYLANNYFSGTGATTINDAGTSTIYAGQAMTAGGLNIRFKQAASTSAVTVQNASGVNVLNVDTTNGELELGSYNGGVNAVGGKVVFGTTTNSNTVTLLSAAQTGNFSLSIPNLAANSTIMTDLTGIQNQNASVQTTANFWISGTGRADTSIVTPSLDTASAGALTVGGTTATSIRLGNTSGTASLSLSSSNTTIGIATSATTLQATAQTTSNTQGNAFTIQGSNGNGTGNGGILSLQGGNGGASGQYGGNISLSGGTGTVSNGLVILSTPTFSTTANDSACYTSGTEVASSCTISQTSVNNSAAVLVGFTVDGQTATLPSPSITTAGRVVYVTASNLSKDFTLSVNGGGTGNQIAMRKNTSATMIWNGTAWTAAGASSSTTMQAAYDNTLQSAGGAELVVSKTSSTNGLTIRDSLTNSVDGTILSVQTKSASGLFQVNSNVTEYATNAGAETAGGTPTTFPANTWSAVTGSTVTRYNTAGNYIATGQGSVSVSTPATANSGVKNQLSTSLTANTTYNVSFTTRLLSGSFTSLNVHYSVDGTAASIPCILDKSALTSIWQKINCTFKTPTSGITSGNAIFIRQGAGVAREFYVDNLSVTIAANYNFATDGSVSDSGNFATNWSSAGLGTVSVTRNTSDGYDASDSANVNITAGAVNAGLRNKLSSNPLPNTLYRMTVYAKSSNAFSDFKIRYSPNNGTNFEDCIDYNIRTPSTTSWTKITCYITTGSTTVTAPYVYFAEATSAVRSFGVDAFNMSISTVTTPNVQIGGGVNGGPTTLFTLDKGASAPIASDNDALLGSMYYDTTLGKLQCYEADGWGSCGSSPGNVITISPEYTNAVMHGTGVGTMVSDICSDPFNINDGSSSQPTICGTNETYNFYRWTSPQATAQTYSIYVTYQLPSTFKGFSSGKTSLMGRTDSSNSTVEYQVYRNITGSGITACGSTIAVSSGNVASWQTGIASGAADPSTCGFAAGNSIVFKINVIASQNASAYVGNLNFTFNNQ